MSSSEFVAALQGRGPTAADDQALIALFSAGNMQALLEQAGAWVMAHPGYAFGWKAQGLALLNLQRPDEAAQALRRALDLQPDDAEGWANLGILLQESGKLPEAEDALRRALAVDSQLAAAHGALGVLLSREGRDDEAEAVLRQALSLQPQLPRVNGALGEILARRGQFADAEQSFKQELALEPGNPVLINQIGRLILWQRRLGDAVAVFRYLVELAPDFVEGHNNLGVVLQQAGHLTGAEEAFRKALSLRADSAEIYSNLGNVLQRQGRFIEAQSAYRRALALNPRFYDAHSNLVGAMNECENVTPQMRLNEALRYGENLARNVAHRYSEWICPEQPVRLRVGLVSGDLRNHPVAYFTLGVLRALDRSRVEVFAYPSTLEADAMTAEIRAACDHWTPIAGLSDQAAADRIHADGVHVLIDMSGHTADNRLPVFASRPAPVQLSWPGYFATTGVAEIDWFLADAISVPPQQAGQFVERIHYLPDTRLCFTPPQQAPDVAPPPLLQRGKPTFGCFQNLSKLNDAVLSLWARVLAAVPQSRLRVQSRQLDEPESRQRLMQRMQACGLDLANVDLYGGLSREDYLAAYAEVDVVLDTFPYTGGTTTCEALWMGVPSLTLVGDSLIARQGASLMSAAGLPEWVCETADDYVAKAVEVVSDPGHLAELRAGLRARVSASALCDAPRFARQLEAALWSMWSQCDAVGKR